jgi:CRISPR-associated protein Csb1
MDYEKLGKAPRIMIEAGLRPAAGDRFQPTGFADIGAAEYQLPGTGTRMLLVESAQSVANRLEKTVLAGDGPRLAPELDGLPYVVAKLQGDGISLETSSLVEAHRIGSPYFILNEQLVSKLKDEMSYGAKLPLDWKKIYATLFKYDVNSLIHGVFLSLMEGGRVKVPRAVTGFIEARDVVRVLSGGVKNSPIDPTGQTQVADAPAGEAGVYSNVPYTRVEYTAAEIKAYFSLDLALIRGYELGDSATKLLISLCLLKVRRFLDSSLRLRTSCDLVMTDVKGTSPQGFVLAEEAELLKDVQSGIKACAAHFAKPAVTELETKVKVVDKKEKKEKK